jgi:hypothetical protein
MVPTKFLVSQAFGHVALVCTKQEKRAWVPKNYVSPKNQVGPSRATGGEEGEIIQTKESLKNQANEASSKTIAFNRTIRRPLENFQLQMEGRKKDWANSFYVIAKL